MKKLLVAVALFGVFFLFDSSGTFQGAVGADSQPVIAGMTAVEVDTNTADLAGYLGQIGAIGMENITYDGTSVNVAEPTTVSTVVQTQPTQMQPVKAP